MLNYKTRVAYRTVGTNRTAGNLSCGFIYKPDDSGSNRNIQFEHYGGFLLLDGDGEYIDKNGAVTKLTKGAFVQRLPGVKHSTIVKSECKWLEFFICIGAESYHNLLTMGLMSDDPVMFCDEKTLFGLIPELNSLLSKMKTASEKELPQIYFDAQSLLCTITSKCSMSGADEDLAAMACRLIERYSGRISGEEVASQLNIGYETLRKQFKKVIGLPMGKYAIRVRVNRAKTLIMRSEITLEKLAAQLGYPDYFSFCKQFKQHTGITPAQFRDMN